MIINLAMVFREFIEPVRLVLLMDLLLTIIVTINLATVFIVL